MANADRAFGLKPVKYLNGTPYNGKVTMYYHPSGGGIIGKNTVVTKGTTADTLGNAPTCAAAGVTDSILGVAVGFGNTKNIAAYVTDLDKVYVASTDTAYIAVADDPDLLFEVQEDNASSAHLAAASVWLNCVLAGNSVSTTTGMSTGELASGGATTAYASAPLQLMGVVDRPDNVMGSSADHTKWLVRIADHIFQQPTTGS